MQYAVIIEKSDTGFGAFVPDLPGCVAVGETEDEVRQLIREAIAFHLDGLREDGEPVPHRARGSSTSTSRAPHSPHPTWASNSGLQRDAGPGVRSPRDLGAALRR